MKRKQIYHGLVTDKISFGGKAAVCIEDSPDPDDNGKIVYVKNVIPGQHISFCLKRQEKGDLVSVIEKSPLETEEVCPIFGECGGCIYLSMEHKAQNEMKLQMVRGLFSDDDICRELLKDIHPSPKANAYRNKMEYSFGDMRKGGELTLGLHKRSSRHDVLTADSCLLVDEDCNEAVRRSLLFFQNRNVPFYHKRELKGFLRHLIIRRSENTKELLITLVTTSQYDGIDKNSLFDDYVAALTAPGFFGSIAGILHTTNDSLSDAVKDEGTRILYGKDYITERVLGLDFRISPFSFFQTNTKGAEMLYSVIRDYCLSCIDENVCPVIFDLYSGTGTIAQILAPVAKHVTGVEIVEEAVAAARENATLNGLKNCDFLVGDVLKVLDEIEEQPDLLILDPPRDGVHPKALEKILAYGVKHIIYISCKPTSLVRDLEMCRQAGYEAEKMCCVDMFPGTGHVETVVSLFQPPKNRETIKVDVDVSSMEPTIGGAEYTIVEEPCIKTPHTVKPCTDSPTLEKPILETPTSADLTYENHRLLSKDIPSKDKSNTEYIKYGLNKG